MTKEVLSTVRALKLALEALEETWYHVGTFQPTEKAIDLYDEARAAIKEALAQPEPWEKFCDSNCVWTDHHADCELAQQEPVKIAHKHEWFRTGEMKIGQMRCISCGTWGQEETPQRKPLTDRQVERLYRNIETSRQQDARSFEAFKRLLRVIEAAHGIKENT